jgi:hypothetical protein
MLLGPDLILINFARVFYANLFASTGGGLLDETTEGNATVTADACVRALAQWLLTNGTPGAVLAGRISQARSQFDRSRRSLFKNLNRCLKLT